MPRRRIKVGNRAIALDARPDRLDLRDRAYLPRLVSLPHRWPSDELAAEWLPGYVGAGLILDQGNEGACTGFGLAAVINYLHFVKAERAPHDPAVRRASPAMLYELARLYDEWPGEDYDGSSCRGALKGWHRHGVCAEDLWPYQLDANGQRRFVRPREDNERRDDPLRNWDLDALACTIGVYYRIDARSVVDMQAAIFETGAIYCSGTVHEGWSPKPSKQLQGHEGLARIKHVASPRDAGGHAFALVGYNQAGFVVQNSWGEGWGSRGFALLPYEAWIAHGEDAWVFTLGVPSVRAHRTGAELGQQVRSPHYFVPPPEQGDRDPAERPAGVVASSDALERCYRAVPPRVAPLDTDTAYRHTIVLDRGFPLRNDLTTPNAAAAVKRVVHEYPIDWLTRQKSNKLLIYAHGGLNSEATSITRIRALAPYALDAGIYPLFVSWRSGPLETVSDLVEEALAKLGFGARGVQPARGWLDTLTEKTDRILEPLLRAPGGALWQQMKLNAQRASDHAEGGCRVLCKQLEQLIADRPKLEIHLIGHSAGAVLLGTMLPLLTKAGIKLGSLRLLAPASTLRFTLDRYRPAIQSKTLDPKRWHIHTLSDQNERNDSVGPYRKSLLYLVSRAFEDQHKTPLLGFERAFDPRSIDTADDLWAGEQCQTVREWIAFWTSLKVDGTNRAAHVLSRPSVSTGARGIKSSHGCFDNAVDILGDALGYIRDPNAPKRVKIYRLED
jgi:hypothetical protein